MSRDDERGSLPGRLGETRLSRLRLAHGVAFLLEVETYQLADVFLVFDD
jgi:hypothetical protein